jgi:hypothetical protein
VGHIGANDIGVHLGSYDMIENTIYTSNNIESGRTTSCRAYDAVKAPRAIDSDELVYVVAPTSFRVLDLGAIASFLHVFCP